jgi:branched-chain amino acid transport system permease protein
MKKYRWPILFFVIAATLPLWLLQEEYLLTIAFNVLIFAALGIAWNVIGGFGGQLALGNAAFFGIGAYVTAIGSATFGVNPWMGIILGALLASIVSVIIGYPCFKLRGIYFSLATFAFSLILGLLAKHYISFTGGSIGMSVSYLGSAPLQFQFDSKLPFYFIALLIVALFIIFSKVIKSSKFGYYLDAIRNDEEAAASLGINSSMIKSYAYMISAGMSGVIGGLYVQSYLLIVPEIAFGLNTSVDILLMAVVGGVGYIWGPVIGAIFLIPLSDITNHFFGSIPGIDVIVYAIVLILVVKFLPRGLITIPDKLTELMKKRRATNAKIAAFSKKFRD